uniref:Uncharacterized protein n=1 Tax=Ditylenchus dipsaci TaxID=166011 RepID=A0A915EIT6_9BILA
MAVLHLKDKHPQLTPTDTRRMEQKRGFAVLQLKKDKKQVGGSQHIQLPQVEGLDMQSYSHQECQETDRKPMAILHLKSIQLSDQFWGDKQHPYKKFGPSAEMYTGELAELPRAESHLTQTMEGLVQSYHTGYSSSTSKK